MTTQKSRGARGVALAVAMLCAGSLSWAADAARTGKDVVSEVCVECHQAGKDGAPRIGELQDWLPRMSHGMGTLADHAIHGYRKMPSHGKKVELSDLEVSRAVAYMINPNSGLKETDSAFNSRPILSGYAIYTSKCQECHAQGKNGAPRIDDANSWLPRIKQGVDTLASHAAHGHKGMPARGGMASLSDSDVRGAVVFMITNAVSSGVVASSQTPK